MDRTHAQGRHAAAGIGDPVRASGRSGGKPVAATVVLVGTALLVTGLIPLSMKSDAGTVSEPSVSAFESVEAGREISVDPATLDGIGNRMTLRTSATALSDAPRVELPKDSRSLAEAAPAAESAFALKFPMAATAGIGCLLASAYWIAKRKRRSGRLPAPAATGPSAPTEAANDHPVYATTSDLADAASGAGIFRIVLVGVDGTSHLAGVALARETAARGIATVLADFADGALAAKDMSLIEKVEDVVAVASDPTTLAHAINRDRRSAAHAFAAALDAVERGRGAVADAASDVLEALAQVYAQTVVIVDASDIADLRGLLDENTAIVVPAAAGDDRAVSAVLDRLAADGFADVVRLTHDGVHDVSQAA